MLASQPFSQFTPHEQRRLRQAAFRIVEEDKKIQKNSIVVKILGSYFGLANPLFYPGKSKQEIERIRMSKEYVLVCRKLEKSLMRMKQRRLITITKTASGLVIALTAQGVLEGLKQRIITTKNHLPNGLYCYVIFDIPEDVHNARQMLRTFLRQAKFTMIQKSVWRTDRDIRKPLVALIKSAKVNKWVSVIQGCELH